MTVLASKIKTISDLAKIVAAARGRKQTIALCHGIFDVIHPGHIHHLEAAARQGDLLIVSVTPDRYVDRGPGRPIFQHQHRCEVLASLESVDYVLLNDSPTAVKVIQTLQPDVYVKGNEYADHTKDLAGGFRKEEAAALAYGGRLFFTNELTFSSSSIANNVFNVYPKETTEYLKGLRVRVSEEEILANLNRITTCKALVIGDSIIDEYHYCLPMGKSPKENIIVTRYTSEERFAGGVLAAANHLASLCCDVNLVTYLGEENSHSDFVRANLKPNVRPTLFTRKNCPTIVKRRFVEPNYMRKLFEICFMNGELLTTEEEIPLKQHLEAVIAEYDLVLVTDFGHGLMTPDLIDLVCRKAKFLAVNAQSNSANTGYNYITKYPRADYICIDEPEARLALQDRVSELELIIKRLSQQLDARYVTITRGHHGCISFARDEGMFRIPVLVNSVVDTVGAGDAFLSISSPCVAMGLPMEQASFIGNAAGALKVGIVGNRSSIEKVPLTKFITTLLK